MYINESKHEVNEIPPINLGKPFDYLGNTIEIGDTLYVPSDTLSIQDFGEQQTIKETKEWVVIDVYDYKLTDTNATVSVVVCVDSADDTIGIKERYKRFDLSFPTIVPTETINLTALGKRDKIDICY
jgi:hypothetical protein